MIDKITQPIGQLDLIDKTNEIIDAIPTSTTQLTNDSGYITGITSTMVTNALGHTPVYLDTDQEITGVKTFKGDKRIKFKQATSTNKLGFTLYDNNDKEKGYLEFNPTNTIDNAPLMTLGNYAQNASSITHVGFRKYSSVSGANGAYNLLTPLVSDAKAPFKLTTSYTNFYFPLGFSDGSTTVKAAKSGVVDLSGLSLGSGVINTIKVNGTALTPTNKTVNITVPTSTTQLTNDSGYITGITSSDVTSALGFTPYSSANPSGYQANVIETVKVNGTALTPSSKTVDVTVPTTTSSVTSGSAAALTSGGAYTNLLRLSGAQTVTGNKTFSGTSTFSNTVSLGSKATATTPTVTSNDTTVATTKFVKDQGYITTVTSTDVTNALGFTPYSSANPSGYQANVIETVKVNGTALTPSTKTVSFTVPTSTTQLTNDSGYITSSSLPTVMTGATSSAAGASGLVPAPAAGDETKFLRGDGTFADAGAQYAMVVTDYTA